MSREKMVEGEEDPGDRPDEKDSRKAELKALFGRRLKAAMEAKDLISPTLAKKAKTSRQNVDNWSSGETMPNGLLKYLELARVLDVSLDYLLDKDYVAPDDDRLSRSIRDTVYRKVKAYDESIVHDVVSNIGTAIKLLSWVEAGMPDDRYVALKKELVEDVATAGAAAKADRSPRVAPPVASVVRQKGPIPLPKHDERTTSEQGERGRRWHDPKSGKK